MVELPVWRGEERPGSLPWETVWADILGLYKTGLHPAIALAIAHKGEVVLDRAVGHRVPGGTERVGPHTLYNLFSASKILTAAVVSALLEREVLRLEEPLVASLHEMAGTGKEGIRLRHLLQHSAGISEMPQGLEPMAALGDPSQVLGPLLALPAASPPGRRVAYHPISSWLLLSLLVERKTGKDLRTLSRELLLDPLGLKEFGYGVAAKDLGRVALHARTGLDRVPVMEGIFQKTTGVSTAVAVQISNHPAFLQAVLPSANVIGTARDTLRLLECLRLGGELDGVRVLKPETVRRMLEDETPRSFDGTFGFPMRYGLGMMKGGDRFSLFGMRTRKAFGHLGFSNVLVYSDPERQLSVAFLNTGKPMLAPGMVPWAMLVQRLAAMVPRERS
jgi:CubicO group peptidase (beta-lactamase class C family)